MMLAVQGHPAYCYTGGKAFDASLPCAVFIHGAQNDHSVWALQTRYFAHHGFAVLAVDLPGHGRSAGAALATVEAQAQWLLALLDAAGVAGGATLIGHSMGSLIALQAAALAPQRCVALAMVGTAYPMRVSEALLTAARGPEQEAIEMVTLWSHSSLAPKPSSPGPGFSVIGGSRRLMQKVARASNADGTPARVFLTDFLACNAYAGGEAAAANVTCATLLLLGAADQMTPPKATATLRAALPHATVVQVAAAGHVLMAEQPDAVLDALFGFARAAQVVGATRT
jgi:pimeloyl-ACP methyl ester carboxylesterase